MQPTRWNVLNVCGRTQSSSKHIAIYTMIPCQPIFFHTMCWKYISFFEIEAIFTKYNMGVRLQLWLALEAGEYIFILKLVAKNSE